MLKAASISLIQARSSLSNKRHSRDYYSYAFYSYKPLIAFPFFASGTAKYISVCADGINIFIVIMFEIFISL